MPPPPSPRGQQGAPEIQVTGGELIESYREQLSECQYQLTINSILLRKTKAELENYAEALAQRAVRIAELEAALLDASTKPAADVARIAELEAEVAALKERQERAGIPRLREYVDGVADEKPARKKQAAAEFDQALAEHDQRRA